jgi:hypothetical protein
MHMIIYGGPGVLDRVGEMKRRQIMLANEKTFLHIGPAPSPEFLHKTRLPDKR